MGGNFPALKRAEARAPKGGPQPPRKKRNRRPASSRRQVKNETIKIDTSIGVSLKKGRKGGLLRG